MSPDHQVHTVLHHALDAARALILTTLSATPPQQLKRWDKQTVLGNGEIRTSPVTELDVAVQRLIIQHLQAGLGDDIGILAEEDGHHHRAALDQPVVVVCDPIDGTRLLLRGLDTYTVNLAVILDTSRVIAAVDFPGLGWRFDAPDGVLRRNGHPLRPAPDPSWQQRLTVAVKPSHADPGLLPARLADGRRLLTLPLGGIAAKLMAVVRGEAQAMLVLPSTPYQGYGLWDVLPMSTLLGASGIQVYGLGGEDLTSFQPHLWPDDPPRWPGGIIAGRPEVINALLAVLPAPAALPRID